MASIQHVWHDSSAAVAYVNAENATRPSARLLVSKSKLTSAVSASEDVYVFDLATGTGAAVHEIYAAVPKEHWGNLRILGGDVSEPMLEYLGATGKREGWRRLETRVVDGKVCQSPPFYTTLYNLQWIYISERFCVLMRA
jgi:SAM-dependent methyltransferase